MSSDKLNIMQFCDLSSDIIECYYLCRDLILGPGRVAQSVRHLTRKSGVLGSIPGLATYFCSPSAFTRRAVVSYWRKYVHENLPRKSVVRLTDRPDMTLDVYCGRKTTMQQQQLILGLLWFE